MDSRDVGRTAIGCDARREYTGGEVPKRLGRPTVIKENVSFLLSYSETCKESAYH